MRLTDFSSNGPYCAPSRAGLQTGRYQFRSGVTGNPTPDRGVDDVLGGDEIRGLALFDLENDRAEQHNVLAQHPEVVRRLMRHYEKLDSRVKAAATERSKEN